MTTAVVVGSGPNGLAAAVTLAQAGLEVTVLEQHTEIGGGTRTAELTLPGVQHDVCSAVHPFALSSPYLTSLPLAEHGLTWRWPEIDLAHPLDGGRAGVVHRSLETTVEELGVDGPAWRRIFEPLGWGFDDLAVDILKPVLHVPRHPVRMGRFGLRAGLPMTLLARTMRTDEGRALLAGVGAHVQRPLNRPATSAVGVMLTAAGHRGGWPVAEGGSQAITRALASLLRSLGGVIETGVRVGTLGQVDPYDVALFDTSPRGLLAIAGDALPARVRRAYSTWKYGPAAFKVDLAVEGGVPWTRPEVARAGTVHVGGTLEEIAAAEAEVHRGVLPARPFVLLAQQHVADPSRSAGEVHPVWAYAHVPNGFTGDVTEALLDQVERFAPGLRERIVARHVTSPAQYEKDNPNYVGGDIAAGANGLGQLLLRPRWTADPYATGIPGVFLCSASTPPGAGAHGMCGHNAARRALRDL